MSHQQKARSLKSEKKGQQRQSRRQVHKMLDEITRVGEYEVDWEHEELLLRAS